MKDMLRSRINQMKKYIEIGRNMEIPNIRMQFYKITMQFCFATQANNLDYKIWCHLTWESELLSLPTMGKLLLPGHLSIATGCGQRKKTLILVF
jgi:hypothetical protein